MTEKVRGEAKPRDEQQVTRRTFLRTASAAAAAAGTGWAKSPVYALAPARVIGANDRVNIGHIGVGGMGGGHVGMIKGQLQALNVAQTAVCDIYKPRLEKAAQSTGVPGSKTYHDYRKLLEDKDVDAVVIATPEHWHAIQTVEALEAGKHVYLEKPMSRYPEEALKIYDAVERTKCVLQVGSQGCSDLKWHRANELITAGKIGKVLWAQASYCRHNPSGEWNYSIDEGANPDNLDWQAFLGPAPKRPFDKERFFRWRKYWDYSAGIVTDLFPHRFNPFQVAMGMAWPKRVVSTGGQYVERSHKDRDVADNVFVLVDYDNDSTVLLVGSTENQVGIQDIIRGTKATMFLGGDSLEIRPERSFVDEIDQLNEKPGGREDQKLHEANWVDCIRTGKLPNCNYQLATRVAVAIGMAERAYRYNKCMLFDPTTREIKEG
jgi:predicted dehydrogenase